jgi:hypothetical protein
MSLRSRLLIVFTVATCILLLVPAAGLAAPVGTFRTVGTGDVRVGASFIDWGHAGPVFESATYTNCVVGPNPGPCVLDGTTTGDILFTSGTGSFTGLNGTMGTIKDLEDDFAPTNTAFTLANFLVAAANPSLNFTLTFIPPGSGSAAGCTDTPGAVCTPPNSPFTITNLADTDGDGTADDAIVGLSLRGTVTDGTPGVSNFAGRFSTQIGMSAGEAIQLILSQGYIESSHSADFSAVAGPIVIPEPSSVVLIGGGALMLFVSRLRRRKLS